VKRATLISLILILAAPTAVGAEASPRVRLQASASWHGGLIARDGDWIAYSTFPADAQPGFDQQGALGPSGSDIFISRLGGQTRFVSGSGYGSDFDKVWNVCPAFSPNGKMLAFGRKAPWPWGTAIVVVGIAPDGTVSAPRATLKVPGPSWRCSKWSTDSSRLAYVDGSGKLVVRGLDGSTRHWAPGDPTIHDFDRHPPELPSPGGDLVATNGGSAVSRLDGSDKRDIPSRGQIVGWSPDGRKLLVIQDDVGGNPDRSLPPCGGGSDFTLRAVSVQAPFTSTPIASYVCVNTPRTSPGYGDVSWQPIPRR
jgi:hypothetical protein